MFDHVRMCVSRMTPARDSPPCSCRPPTSTCNVAASSPSFRSPRYLAPWFRTFEMSDSKTMEANDNRTPITSPADWFRRPQTQRVARSHNRACSAFDSGTMKQRRPTRRSLTFSKSSFAAVGLIEKLSCLKFIKTFKNCSPDRRRPESTRTRQSGVLPRSSSSSFAVTSNQSSLSSCSEVVQ